MHRRGGDGVNKQQHNKITPEVGKPALSRLKKRTLQNHGSMI